MKKRKIWLISAISFFALSSSAFGAYEFTKKNVDLNLDGKVSTVRTHEATVKDILDNLDVSYDENDLFSHELNAKVDNDILITWTPTKEVYFRMNGEEKELHTKHDTVKDLLNQMEVDVSEHDKLNVPLDSKIVDNLLIDYEKAFEVFLQDGLNELSFMTTSTTVADLLQKENIKLNQFDKISFPSDKLLTNGEKIVITRVEKTTDVVEETVSFVNINKKDASLKKGTKKVVQTGVSGKKKKTFEVIKENGKVISKVLISEEIVTNPIDEIVHLGTKISSPQVSRGKEKSDKEFYVHSTAFTASCNGCTGVTATGFNLKTNPNAKVIAVDPSVIPLGTKVYIEGYGYATALDTGKNIKGNRIDVFFPTKQEAYAWGNKNVKIKIIGR